MIKLDRGTDMVYFKNTAVLREENYGGKVDVQIGITLVKNRFQMW